MKATNAMLQRYVEMLARRMRLGEWVFECSIEDISPDHMAQFESIDGCTRRGRVKLQSETLELPPEEQRISVVHELCHAHFLDVGLVSDAVTKVSADILGPMVENLLDNIEEAIVDEMARIIAPSMPLPPWSVSTPETPGVSRTRSPTARKAAKSRSRARRAHTNDS